MSTAAARPGPPRPPKKPFRKRYAVLLTLLGLLAILLIVGVVRGTWADREPRDSKSTDEGVICRLYQPPEGDWQVRCSMILDEPFEKVWSVVTDYDNFTTIFPTLESCDFERSKNGDVRLFGEAHSAIGTWPCEIIVKHEVAPGRFHSHWEGEEGEAGDVQKVKGSWTVTPAGEDRTLLVYASHIEIKRYPDWIVVNALLLRQPKVMHAVADWLARAKE